MYEDDEGVWDRIRTTGSDRPVVCGNGFADGGIIDPHAECRIALDAAQDEIERLLSEVQTLRASGDSPGAGMIAEERSRQVNVEGYSREHDAGHGSRNLSLAATAYALDHRGHWPWERDSFKPTRDRVRDLTKAGALIAAAIDVELAARDSGGAS